MVARANSREEQMYRYVLKRIFMLIPIMLAVSFIVYFIVDLAPGDAIDAMYGNEISQEQKDQIREELGYNDPLVIRYGRYMWDCLHGDMGTSTSYNSPVAELYFNRFPATLQLAFWGIFIALLIAIPLGIIAAVHQNSLVDSGSMILGLIGMSMPNFWLGLMLIILFAQILGLLPSGGNEQWNSIILPAITMGVGQAALLIRTTRSSMLEVIRQDYLRTARAKGVSERKVIYHHALRNALIPIITAAGTQLGIALGGSVVVESVFAWPGVGKLTIDAFNSRDTTLVVGCLILTTAFSSILMMFMDILYAYVDPRIKARYTK